MTTKVAIVTGGARGIGKAITEVLLKQNYKVAIFEINEETGKQTADELSSRFCSGSCVFFKCDVTDSEQVKGCCEQVEKLVGSISVLVNNAAYFNDLNPRKLIETNLTAVIETTYLAVNKMRKDTGGPGGTVVNISSATGLTSFPGKVAYTASKWGVVGFTLSMARSLGMAEDWGVSVMTLCPTATATPNLGRSAPSMAPAAPDACKTFFAETMKHAVPASLDELASAFETLLKDNKNGAVMRMSKEKGAPAKAEYVEHKWSEV